MNIGWVGVALSALTLLPAATLAAIPDPALRRSEQLDTRRLGKVSADERSVLRIEWRAAVTGADEARTVEAMLDSLRRMEGTIGEINRLVQNIPARKPAVAVVVAEPPDSDGYDTRMVLANIAAACLVALWWFRRRSSAGSSAPPKVTNTAAAASPPLEAAPAKAPPADMTAGEPSASRPKPARLDEKETVREMPPTATRTIEAEAVPAPVVKPGPEPTAQPGLAAAEPSVPPPAEDSHVIDFMLEDAEPEVVAREKARLQKLEAMDRRKDPERKQASNIDPTLELAEIMLSLGLEQGAAKTLLEYTEANPRQALQHWLKLLDIYRNSGHRNDFKEAAEKLRQNFNIQAEDWITANAGESPVLENFSRLSEQIQQTWSRPAECIAYLQHLLEDNREGSRAGFPRPVAEEILLLINILKELSGPSQTAAA